MMKKQLLFLTLLLPLLFGIAGCGGDDDKDGELCCQDDGLDYKFPTSKGYKIYENSSDARLSGVVFQRYGNNAMVIIPTNVPEDYPLTFMNSAKERSKGVVCYATTVCSLAEGDEVNFKIQEYGYFPSDGKDEYVLSPILPDVRCLIEICD